MAIVSIQCREIFCSSMFGPFYNVFYSKLHQYFTRQREKVNFYLAFLEIQSGSSPLAHSLCKWQQKRGSSCDSLAHPKYTLQHTIVQIRRYLVIHFMDSLVEIRIGLIVKGLKSLMCQDCLKVRRYTPFIFPEGKGR